MPVAGGGGFKAVTAAGAPMFMHDLGFAMPAPQHYSAQWHSDDSDGADEGKEASAMLRRYCGLCAHIAATATAGDEAETAFKWDAAFQELAARAATHYRRREVWEERQARVKALLGSLIPRSLPAIIPVHRHEMAQPEGGEGGADADAMVVVGPSGAPDRAATGPNVTSLMAGAGGEGASYVRLRDGLFVHVWAAERRGREFQRAMQRIWVGLTEARLGAHGVLRAPVVALCTFRGAALTVIPLAPLSGAVDPLLPAPIPSTSSVQSAHGVLLALLRAFLHRFPRLKACASPTALAVIPESTDDDNTEKEEEEEEEEGGGPGAASLHAAEALNRATYVVSARCSGAVPRFVAGAGGAKRVRLEALPHLTAVANQRERGEWARVVVEHVVPPAAVALVDEVARRIASGGAAVDNGAARLTMELATTGGLVTRVLHSHGANICLALAVRACVARTAAAAAAANDEARRAACQIALTLLEVEVALRCLKCIVRADLHAMLRSGEAGEGEAGGAVGCEARAAARLNKIMALATNGDKQFWEDLNCVLHGKFYGPHFPAPPAEGGGSLPLPLLLRVSPTPTLIKAMAWSLSPRFGANYDQKEGRFRRVGFAMLSIACLAPPHVMKLATLEQPEAVAAMLAREWDDAEGAGEAALSAPRGFAQLAAMLRAVFLESVVRWTTKQLPHTRALLAAAEQAATAMAAEGDLEAAEALRAVVLAIVASFACGEAKVAPQLAAVREDAVALLTRLGARRPALLVPASGGAAPVWCCDTDGVMVATSLFAAAQLHRIGASTDDLCALDASLACFDFSPSVSEGSTQLQSPALDAATAGAFDALSESVSLLAADAAPSWRSSAVGAAILARSIARVGPLAAGARWTGTRRVGGARLLQSILVQLAARPIGESHSVELPHRQPHALALATALADAAAAALPGGGAAAFARWWVCEESRRGLPLESGRVVGEENGADRRHESGAPLLCNVAEAAAFATLLSAAAIFAAAAAASVVPKTELAAVILRAAEELRQLLAGALSAAAAQQPSLTVKSGAFVAAWDKLLLLLLVEVALADGRAGVPLVDGACVRRQCLRVAAFSMPLLGGPPYAATVRDVLRGCVSTVAFVRSARAATVIQQAVRRRSLRRQIAGHGQWLLHPNAQTVATAQHALAAEAATWAAGLEAQCAAVFGVLQCAAAAEAEDLARSRLEQEAAAERDDAITTPFLRSSGALVLALLERRERLERVGTVQAPAATELAALVAAAVGHEEAAARFGACAAFLDTVVAAGHLRVALVEVPRLLGIEALARKHQTAMEDLERRAAWCAWEARRIVVGERDARADAVVGVLVQIEDGARALIAGCAYAALRDAATAARDGVHVQRVNAEERAGRAAIEHDWLASLVGRADDVGGSGGGVTLLQWALIAKVACGTWWMIHGIPAGGGVGALGVASRHEGLGRRTIADAEAAERRVLVAVHRTHIADFLEEALAVHESRCRTAIAERRDGGVLALTAAQHEASVGLVVEQPEVRARHAFCELQEIHIRSCLLAPLLLRRLCGSLAFLTAHFVPRIVGAGEQAARRKLAFGQAADQKLLAFRAHTVAAGGVLLLFAAENLHARAVAAAEAQAWLQLQSRASQSSLKASSAFVVVDEASSRRAVLVEHARATVALLLLHERRLRAMLRIEERSARLAEVVVPGESALRCVAEAVERGALRIGFKRLVVADRRAIMAAEDAERVVVWCASRLPLQEASVRAQVEAAEADAREVLRVLADVTRGATSRRSGRCAGRSFEVVSPQRQLLRKRHGPRPLAVLHRAEFEARAGRLHRDWAPPSEQPSPSPSQRPVADSDANLLERVAALVVAERDGRFELRDAEADARNDLASRAPQVRCNANTGARDIPQQLTSATLPHVVADALLQRERRGRVAIAGEAERDFVLLCVDFQNGARALPQPLSGGGRRRPALPQLRTTTGGGGGGLSISALLLAAKQRSPPTAAVHESRAHRRVAFPLADPSTAKRAAPLRR